MFETLSEFLQQAGPFAPIVYVSLYLATALLPVIPTPLVSALGGSFLGTVPAIGYGVVGLGLGALFALTLSRRLGRPLVVRLIGERTWTDWEYLLGIRSPVTWGVIFFVLNIDFAVLVAGLSGLRLWQLWLAAVVARLPWLVLSAWFGQSIFESQNFLPQMLLILAVLVLAIQIIRVNLKRYLQRHEAREAAASSTASSAASSGETASTDETDDKKADGEGSLDSAEPPNFQAMDAKRKL